MDAGDRLGRYELGDNRGHPCRPSTGVVAGLVYTSQLRLSGHVNIVSMQTQDFTQAISDGMQGMKQREEERKSSAPGSG